jgi:hypothetical protein
MLVALPSPGCADDVGAAVQAFTTLRIFEEIFFGIQAATVLRLKGKKCVLVLLGGPFRLQDAALLREWLVSHLPRRCEFCIEAFAKYLGYWFGPAVTSENFAAPLLKHRSRTCLIAKPWLPPSQAVVTYNVRAASVLTFVSHLSPPGNSLLPVEAWAASKVLRAPGITMSAAVAAHLDQLGCPRFRSLTADCLASLLRQTGS